MVPHSKRSSADIAKLRDKSHFEGGEVLTSQGKWCPRRDSTRDLPLRSRIHEPFVFNSYEKPYKTPVHTVHIVLEVLKLYVRG